MGRKRRRKSVNVSGDPVFVDLLRWLTRHGSSPSPSLQLRLFSDSGRGLMARRPVRSGDVIVRIPRRLLVTCDVVRRATVNENFGAAIDSNALSPQEILSVFLVHQRSDYASHWYPYLRTLPSAYDVPFFDADMVRCLPGYLRLRCERQRHMVESSFERIRWFVPSLSDFSWAWFTVNTRAVYLDPEGRTRAGQRDCLALAPFLDMFNHSVDANVETGIVDDHYQIITNVPYSKHSQIFISYGPHDNIKLFTEYGFILDSNPNDVVPLDFEEDFVVSPSTFHRRIIRENHLDRNLNIDGTAVSWNALACLHILALSYDELQTKQWHSIFSASDLIDGFPQIQKTVLCMLSKKLREIENALAKLCEFTTKSTSCLIAISLLEKHQLIVKNSFETLNLMIK